MNALFHRNIWVTKIVVVIITMSFLFGSSPVVGLSKAYAADNMRNKAASQNSALEKLVAASQQANQDGGLAVRTLDGLKSLVKEKKIDSAFIALDWNIKKIKKAEDLERIVKSLDSIEYAFNDMDLKYAYGLTHRMRPKAGVFKQEESLKELVDNAKKLMAERGMKDIIVELLPYDLDQAALRVKELKTQNPGRKIFFVVENIRFYEQEKSKDAVVRKVFEQRLIDMTNRQADKLVYINEAFDKSHRGKEASMELVQLIPEENRAAGKALERDLNAVLKFLSQLTGKMVLVVGGAKFDKLENIAAIAEAKGKDLIVVIVGAQANPWRAFVEGLPVGKSLMPSGEDAETAKEAFEKIAKSGAKVVTPVDFTLMWLVDVLLDKGLQTERTVQQVETASNQKDIPADKMQVDIGAESLGELGDIIASLKKGDGLIMNGGTGKFDEKGSIFRVGTFSMIGMALKAQKLGIATLGAGGDMYEALKLYQEDTKVPVMDMLDFTTGGGVVWAIIAQKPENLPAIKAVLKAEAGQAMADGGTVNIMVANAISFLKNNIRLDKGNRVGRSNIEHAKKEKANGATINHSEDREQYEVIISAKLENVLSALGAAKEKLDRAPQMAEIFKANQLPLIEKNTSLSVEEKERRIAQALQDTADVIKNASDVYKKETNAILADFKAFLSVTSFLPEAEKEYLMAMGKPQGAESKEDKDAREAAVNKQVDAMLEGWIAEIYASTPGTAKQVLRRTTRKITNRIMNQELKAMVLSARDGYVFTDSILCFGENDFERNNGQTEQIVREDATEILADITEADARAIGLKFAAYEPRWAIGGGKPTPTPEEVESTHLILYNTIENILGVPLAILYGGSLSEKNADQMLPLPHVFGGFIGSAGKSPETINPVFQKAITHGQAKGMAMAIFLNFKAENKDTGLKPSADFVEMFKQIDLTKVVIGICTPIVETTRREIQNPLNDWKQNIIKAAAKLKTRINSLINVVSAESTVYEAQGGKLLDDMIKKLTTPRMVASQISDSRGKDTVRVDITMDSGIAVRGESPAGASTGEFEAPIGTTQGAIAAINAEISTLIAQGFDFSKMDDVVRADELIMQKSENFTRYGSKATVAASWALWELHAKLNKQPLYESLRQYMGYKGAAEKLLWMANGINGGLHVIPAGSDEKIGVDFPSIQEFMTILTQFKDFEEVLKFLDEADRQTTKIVNVRFPGKVSRGDEAGVKVKGLNKNIEAIKIAIDAAMQADPAKLPGRDFKISVDVAASSFQKKVDENGKTYYVYNFEGVERSAEWMISYYDKLVSEVNQYVKEKTNGRYDPRRHGSAILSFEDALGEEDWDNHVILTKLLWDKYRIYSIADDVAVTQMDRLLKGIRMGAFNAILIKVNQVGNLTLTMDVMKVAHDNKLFIVVSHRSGEPESRDPGERPYAGIAHLAFAGGDAIKTGGSQRPDAEEFNDPKKLVRRSKYNELVDIQKARQGKRSLVRKEYAYVVSASKIEKAGIQAFSRIAGLANVQLVVVGKGANKVKTAIGAWGVNEKNIIAEPSIQRAMWSVKVDTDKVVFHLTPDDASELAEIKELDKRYDVQAKRIVSDGANAPYEVAKGLQMLFDNAGVDKAFAALDDQMQKQIIVEMPQDQRDLLAKVKQGVFAFPVVQLKALSEKKEKEVQAAKNIRDTFFKQI